LSLPLRDELLIVDGVLREGSVLSAERVVDGVWPCVEPGIVVARLLVDARRIRRKLVVEPVEQDSLASRYQPLDVGATEVEVPSLRMFQLAVPVADPRQWHVHHDPFCYALWKLCRKGVAHHVADVVGNEGDFLQPKLIENDGEVPSLRDLFVTALGMGR
jgi:hypothetical protein